jgi:deoxyribose-phosphate aldolase
VSAGTDQLRPAPASYEELAKMIELPALAPDLSEERVAAACAIARDYGVGAVVVRPTDVELVAGWMRDTGIAVGSVVGHPYGNTTTPVKVYEVRDLARRGAREIDAPINLGKMMSRQFAYVETELMQLTRECREAGMTLKVVVDPAWMTADLRVIALKIARRAEVDYIVAGGALTRAMPAIEDLRFFRQRAGEFVKLKAGGVATLDDALAAHAAGCERMASPAVAQVLDAWKARLAEEAKRKQVEAAPGAVAHPDP